MIKGIKSKDFEEFVNLVNEFSFGKRVFATQTLLEKGVFYGFIYYEEMLRNEEESATEKQVLRLKELGLFKEGLTKREAWILIKERGK